MCSETNALGVKIRIKALIFNDVLLVPHYSEVLPKTVSLKIK